MLDFTTANRVTIAWRGVHSGGAGRGSCPKKAQNEANRGTKGKLLNPGMLWPMASVDGGANEPNFAGMS
jgi:hypothetical protein